MNCTACITPSLLLGWQTNVMMTSSHYTAKMYRVAPDSHFQAKTMSPPENQFKLGAEMLVAPMDNRFSTKLSYEFNIGQETILQAGSIRFQWDY